MSHPRYLKATWKLLSLCLNHFPRGWDKRGSVGHHLLHLPIWACQGNHSSALVLQKHLGLELLLLQVSPSRSNSVRPLKRWPKPRCAKRLQRTLNCCRAQPEAEQGLRTDREKAAGSTWRLLHPSLPAEMSGRTKGLHKTRSVSERRGRAWTLPDPFLQPGNCRGSSGSSNSPCQEGGKEWETLRREVWRAQSVLLVPSDRPDRSS